MPKKDKFKLDVVSVRLVKDAPIYSEHPFNSPYNMFFPADLLEKPTSGHLNKKCCIASTMMLVYRFIVFLVCTDIFIGIVIKMKSF